MLRFAVRQTLSSIVLTIVVTAITYALVFSDGTGIARRVLGQSATQAQVSAKVTELGLDQPVAVQYAKWLGGLARGDLGASYFTGEPVTNMLATRVPVTLAIILPALLLTLILSVLIGVTAAVRGGAVDRFLQVTGVLGAAVPNFVVAIALIFVFAIAVPLFPATGYVSPDVDPMGWAQSLVLPVLAVLIGSIAGAAQQFRGAVIDVLRQDFVRTLRSRGISERAVIFRHVLRNAAGPGMTILSLQTVALMGGVVIIERMFALPGMGLLADSSALQGDIPAVMGSVLFSIAVVIVINIAVDLLVGWLNPKARLS
ncbi:ABC transporter permease [Streptomyces sp. CA-210063]|uniref:ABC transporter permease n=1 Tax=Streptomyces sp. CA-210063 TaxID=2801029 RepID=UPI00214C20A7|nr:ABC transporter permease [Streptomyces sp. CA-210063]UUU29417.1 ABC transporter permease [Streptomyces sp. CA-210063]